MVIPLITGQQIPSEKLQEAMEDLCVSLKKLEDKFLQNKPFIAGTEISLADVVAIVELMQVLSFFESQTSQTLNLHEWSRLKHLNTAMGKQRFIGIEVKRRTHFLPFQL